VGGHRNADAQNTGASAAEIADLGVNMIQMESRLTAELEQAAHRTAINLENAADKTTRNIVIALADVMIVAIALGTGILQLLK
jgi:hypothetical protein